MIHMLHDFAVWSSRHIQELVSAFGEMPQGATDIPWFALYFENDSLRMKDKEEERGEQERLYIHVQSDLTAT
jgi:hypothetical protein